MTVQAGLCRTWSEPQLLVFSRTGLFQFSPNITEKSTTTYGVGEHYEYELTNLEPNTFYLLYIQADNNQGYGAVRSDEEASFNTLGNVLYHMTSLFPSG